MRLKTLILFIICAFGATIPTVQAQLAFEPSEWDFGSIRETDGPVSHTFTGKNGSDRPLVILDVVTTCGCTVPEFSKQPILPGAETRITVTYDPTNRPGTFDRELWVYSSDRKRIATLTIRGQVTPRPKSIEEQYPVDAGGGLRLSSTLCAFSYIYPGKRMQSVIGYANTSPREIRLELRPEITSGLLSADYPQTIAPGARGQINLGYLIPADRPRYGTIRDAMQVFVDGRSRDVRIVTHGIGADNPAGMPEGRAPRCEISENILKFGTVKHNAPERRMRFTLSNTGRGELVVRSVESGGHVAATLRPGTTVPPGQSAETEVVLDPASQQYGVMSDFLIIVTNDPVRPMRRIRVTAIIEE